MIKTDRVRFWWLVPAELSREQAEDELGDAVGKLLVGPDEEQVGVVEAAYSADINGEHAYLFEVNIPPQRLPLDPNKTYSIQRSFVDKLRLAVDGLKE